MQWLMLQQNTPEDFVIATGKQYSVREFIEISAKKLGWECNSEGNAIEWRGKNENEIGIRFKDKKEIIKVDKRYFRPTEVSTLLGDPTYAQKKLKWKPKISFEDLVTEMIENDVEEASKEALLKEKGYKINSPIEFPPTN